MSLIHLAAVGLLLVAVGLVLVCAAHIPGLRTLAGATLVGPVPEPDPDDEDELCALLRALADDLTADGRAEP